MSGFEGEYHYIHPGCAEVCALCAQMEQGAADIRALFSNLFAWFDENIEYSRLNAPYFPLQRSDTDLLKMKSGTCGDYSNLIVSMLLTLEIPAKYAHLSRDCYGDEQDHICAAAYLEGRWTLIDATLPYRKWFGFDCPHKEYELLEPDAFESKMKEIERQCVLDAAAQGREEYAGLLYAPWIHDEPVLCTKDGLDSVFFLMIFNEKDDWTLYANYLSYTSESGRTPVMAAIAPAGRQYRFSINPPESLWDDAQWSAAYLPAEIPAEHQSPQLAELDRCIDKNLASILRIVGND